MPTGSFFKVTADVCNPNVPCMEEPSLVLSFDSFSSAPGNRVDCTGKFFKRKEFSSYRLTNSCIYGILFLKYNEFVR